MIGETIILFWVEKFDQNTHNGVKSIIGDTIDFVQKYDWVFGFGSS